MRISDWSSDVCSSDLFGAAVRDAQARRRQWLIAQGFAVETNGAVRYRSDMLPALQRRELLRNAGQLSDELGMGFVETCPGEQIEGVLRRPVEPAGGRDDLFSHAKAFQLEPLRPGADRDVGQSVSGVARQGVGEG